MRTTLFLLTIFIITSVAKADCLACWELRKVNVILKNGETKTGFVYWNESWLDGTTKNWKELKNRFPVNFIEYHRSRPQQKFHLLTKLTTVKNDSLFGFKAITKEDQQAIQTEDIQKMVELDKDSKKYQGAGDIPIYTLEELKQLMTNPYATYLSSGPVSDTYFLSYNKKIARQQLKEISETNEIKPDELTKMGVLIVSIGYD